MAALSFGKVMTIYTPMERHSVKIMTNTPLGKRMTRARKGALALLAGAGLLALAACGSAEEAGDLLQEPDQSPSTQPGDAPLIAADGIPEDMDADLSAARTDAGDSSAYTRFDLAKCDVLEENREEGSYAAYSCPGYQGVKLFVQEGDGRFDLDAGVDDDAFQTMSPFNYIGDTIEWRMKDGKPFAVIFRYWDATETGKGESMLAVESIGTAGQPGCRVAEIPGTAPNPNQQARELADSRATSFECGEKPLTGRETA